ncbi:MAG TPA: hypothetical protein VGO97_05645 [Solirubrobacterales bacterium]|jgi:hypothetical protein|nr:hypothetical protein [Solirubrobacterales bacterium]
MRIAIVPLTSAVRHELGWFSLAVARSAARMTARTGAVVAIDGLLGGVRIGRCDHRATGLARLLPPDVLLRGKACGGVYVIAADDATAAAVVADVAPLVTVAASSEQVERASGGLVLVADAGASTAYLEVATSDLGRRSGSRPIVVVIGEREIGDGHGHGLARGPRDGLLDRLGRDGRRGYDDEIDLVVKNALGL